MPTEGKKRGKVDLFHARQRRDNGWSYTRIANSMNVTTSAVYYALNPGSRKPGAAEGKQRSVYLGEEIWDHVIGVALSEHVSQSSVVADILTGQRPPFALEPVIADA